MNMKLTKRQMKHIEKFALNYYKKQDYAHNVDHMKTTVKLAEYLAKTENADMDICRLGSLLHQFHDAKKVKKVLEKIEVDKTVVDEVVHCVECCSTYTIQKAKTLEAKVVFDADFLQCLGPIGTCRGLIWLNDNKTNFLKLIKKCQEVQYRSFRLIQTETGKSLAKNLHKFDTEFYKIFNKWYRLKL